MAAPRVLFLDVETRPNLVYTWDVWKANIPPENIVEPSTIICWAARFEGESNMRFDSVKKHSRATMLAGIYRLLDEADFVVHYNGTAFDIPRLNQEFAEMGWTPPSPYRQIDLYRTVAKRFSLPSRKLSYAAKYLKVGAKVKHPGMELWFGCMLGDRASWGLMEKYNKGDVELLEKMYRKLQPWIENHPNRAVYLNPGIPTCNICGSSNLQSRGTSLVGSRLVKRWNCRSCGHWPHSGQQEGRTNFNALRG